MRKFTKRLMALFTAVVMVFGAFVLPDSISVAAKDEQSGRRIVLALGDSYSAGEGIDPFFNQSDSDKETNDNWLAHRSQKAWSGLLKLDGKTVDFNHNWLFYAASGAETKHLTTAQTKETNITGQSTSKDLPAQLEAFEKFANQKGWMQEVDYVTVTIGGNDIGFTDIITLAIAEELEASNTDNDSTISSVCTYIKDGRTLDGVLEEKLDSLYSTTEGIGIDIKNAYKAILNKVSLSPNVKVIVAGYPALLNSSEFVIPIDTSFSVSILGRPVTINLKKDVTFRSATSKKINDAVSEFNQKLESIVNDLRTEGYTNIYFVSVEDKFNGQEAYTTKPYINPVYFGAQAQDLDRNAIVSSYSIHPNEEGAKAYAEAVQELIDVFEKKVTYVDESGNNVQLSYGEYTPVESSSGEVTWTEGTYVVEGNVNIEGTVNIEGDITLVLADDSSLNIGSATSRVEDGIFYKYHIENKDGQTVYVPEDEDTALTIYGQTKGNGELNIYSSHVSLDSCLGLAINDVKVTTDNTNDTYPSIRSDNIVVNSGSLNVSSFKSGITCYFLDYTGGNVNVSSATNTSSSWGITYYNYCRLSWKKASDSFTASSVGSFNNTATLDFKKSFILDSNHEALATKTNINGQKLIPAYGVYSDSILHGSVDADKTIILPGASEDDKKVTITVNPDPGYQLYSLSVTDYRNPETKVEVKASDTGYYFTMPEFDVYVYAVFKKTITPDMITPASDIIYTGSEVTPDVTVNDGETTLVKDTDYTVSYSDNISAGSGTATVKVTSTSGSSYMGSASKNFTINPKPVVVKGITAENKTYDGKTSVTISTSGAVIEGVVTGDELTVSSATGEFTSAAAGTSKDVTITDIVFDGNAKDNYTLDTTGEYLNIKADIDPLPVTISGVAAKEKDYDGTTKVDLDLSNAQINEIIGTDKVEFSVSGALTDAGIGDNKTVILSGWTLSGDDAANYTIDIENSQKTATIGIIPKKVTISDITATNRDYEQGNTKVALSGGKLNGVEDNDDVSIDLTEAVGNMTDDNAGENKSVTITGVKLIGTDKDNYVLSEQPTGVTVTINKITPDLTEPKAKTNLFEDGTSQVLIEAGVSKNGTVLYSVNDSILNKFPVDSDFSADIPEADKAGHYTVWYKVKGNTNYNDIAVKSFEVTISEAPKQDPIGEPQKPTDEPQKPTEPPVQPTVVIDTPEPVNTPVIEKNEDGSTTTTTVQENEDGSFTATKETTDQKGNVLGITTETTSVNDAGTVIVESLKKDADGSTTEIKAKTYESGTTSVKTVETDGTTGIVNTTKETTKTDSEGITTTTLTSKEKDADGKLLSSLSVTTFAEADGTSTTLFTLKSYDTEDGTQRIDETIFTGSNGTSTVIATITSADGIKVNETFNVDKKGSVKITSFDSSSTEVVIPDTVDAGGKSYPVTKISSGAMKGNTALTKVSLNENIKAIGRGAFSGDKNLETIELTDSVIRIHKKAFKGISKNAVFYITAASEKEFERVVNLIKDSGIKSTVKFVMVAAD
jgi:lysophospholipase L1-like esterase